MMKSWKVTIEYKNKTMEIVVSGASYAEAYINAELRYPGCVVKSVSEIRKNNF
jgi:hypothetical protein